MGNRKHPVALIAGNSVEGKSQNGIGESRLTTGTGRARSGKRRRSKNRSNREKRAGRREAAAAVQRMNSQLNVSPGGSGGGGSCLAQSKSENDLFEKSSKLSVDGSSRLFPGYDAVVTSMRDLKFEDVGGDHSSTRAMNDFSRTQVLNTIAISREVVVEESVLDASNDGGECELLVL